jgi:hypothetical protein
MKFSAALVALPELGNICVLRFSGAKFGDEWKLAETRLADFAHWIDRPCVIVQQTGLSDWEFMGWQKELNMAPVKAAFDGLQWYQFTLSTNGVSKDFAQPVASRRTRPPF